LEKGIHDFEGSIMKAFSSSPFGNLLKEMLGNMAHAGGGGGQDRGQSDSAMNEILQNMKSPFGQA
jgi:hypothetical protein